MSSNVITHPKIRWPIDVKTHRHENQDILVLSCPLGVSPKPLLLVSAVGPIISRFEGTLSIDEIHAQFQQYGLQRAQIDELVQLLDTHLFLDTPRFHAAKAEAHRSFLESSVRPPALAGLSYSNNPHDLGVELDRYLRYAAGVKRRAGELVGLVAPHIEYRRGQVCYGLTYDRLREQQHDLYILIGTAHQYSPLLFHLTLKDFQTPLGALPTDTVLVRELAKRHGDLRSFQDEILHRKEHSLEFQLPFIRHVHGERAIVPILVGSFHHMLRSGKSPHDFDEYESFAGSLSELLKMRRAEGRRICIVAGVDMAHVGKHFGDANALTPEFMQQIEQRDRLYLDAIAQRDKKALFAHIAEDEDARRICGFPTMYTVLDILDRLDLRTSCELFDYRQAVDYESDCAVTFAGMGLYLEQ